ncbi:hypothetical protein SAMN05444267_103330 [Chryseobacterium polytrichastri]|uniref:Uncharacterized protein n=1 Tax=Chryseobacterium polytrichastri TaxID=1302687 RepID=A0A1M7FSG8_9FLAO|nr:hypothetical protein SAMN05444267_103330 [Chryseobacterium polytrichastri]
MNMLKKIKVMFFGIYKYIKIKKEKLTTSLFHLYSIQTSSFSTRRTILPAIL